MLYRAELVIDRWTNAKIEPAYSVTIRTRHAKQTRMSFGICVTITTGEV